jgi:hypothetical protein
MQEGEAAVVALRARAGLVLQKGKGGKERDRGWMGGGSAGSKDLGRGGGQRKRARQEEARGASHGQHTEKLI